MSTETYNVDVQLITGAYMPTGDYIPLYCIGERKDGTRCGQMLARVTTTAAVKSIEIKCRRCGTMVLLP